ncbi:MAG: M14 family zinc carboxypeptidase [Thermoplasmatota archaeon]
MKNREKKLLLAAFVVVLLIGILFAAFRFSGQKEGGREISVEDVLSLGSIRRSVGEVIIIPEEEPFFGIAATPMACWYDIGAEGSGAYGLLPLLVSTDNELDDIQSRFLSNTGLSDSYRIPTPPRSGPGILPGGTGAIGEGSVKMAGDAFQQAAGALVLEATVEQYEMGTIAAPLASYLNVPVLVKDDMISWDDISDVLGTMKAGYVICLGDDAGSMADSIGKDAILLRTEEEVQDAVLQVIKARFGRLDYVAMTDPADAVPRTVASSGTEAFTVDVNNLRVETGQVAIDIIGESTDTFPISVPEGIVRLGIHVNFTDVAATPLDPLKEAIEIEPVIFASLYDNDGDIAAYAPSFSYLKGRDYLETLAIDAPGTYELTVQVFYGIDGFNTYAGTELAASRIDGTYEVSVTTEILDSPHFPEYPRLSMMAPYLAASHGGSVFGGPYLELTTEEYGEGAAGHSTGPCYDRDLHDLVNQRVDSNIEKLEAYLDRIDRWGMREDYLSGPAWLAILGGPNMIPQYYEPKETSWEEDVIYGAGWPTDVPYSLGESLSTARVLGEDVGDVSALIARTLFFEQYADGHSRMISSEYGSSEDWGANFHFLAGEMGGRTGWFFWQRTFSDEIRQHGFETEEYLQNYENDRQTMEFLGAYERANFLDLMMHGNWYWYVPELNGLDSYSTGVKNSDIRKSPQEWELGPGVVVTGACILGRIDNVPPVESMTMTFLHAGVNAFYGATRSTGSEAKAGVVERTLLYDDLSVGEALREDKRVNREPAAYWVRNLFADPAFNPYEPENGYSDQGRPVLLGTNSPSTPESGPSGSAPLTRSSVTPFDIDQEFSEYHGYDRLTSELERLSSERPDIIRMVSLGTTYEEREIWAVKISDNPWEREDEPEILFTGAHHGREWPSVEVPLYLIEYLVANHGKGPIDNDGDGAVNEDPFDAEDNDNDGLIDEDEDEARITWLVNNRQIWVVPMLNPDGVEYAHRQYESGQTDIETLWRKNREPNVNPATGEPYPETVAGRDMWGVDINRNYGFHWGELGYQGYADPSREDYIGPYDKSDEDNDRMINEDRMDGIDNDGDGRIDEDVLGGFSATETIAIKELVEDHDFVIAMNFHTYGGKIYWPWMWTLELPPDEETFCELAKVMSNFNGYEYRDMSERAQSQLSRHPPVDGDSNDWMYGKHEILAYTIELGDAFILPEEEILPLCRQQLGANLFVIEASSDPDMGWCEIVHEPLSDTKSNSDYPVVIKVNWTGPREFVPRGVELLYSVDGSPFQTVVMEQGDGVNEYRGMIPGQEAGADIEYYVEITETTGVRTNLPRYSPPDTFAFRVLSTRGEASVVLYALHIFFIMGAIIFMVLAGFSGARYIVKGTGFNKLVKYSGITAGMVFIGGFPLGFALAYQVFGTPWTGVPFGWDITDNKTLVIFLYWMISLVLVKGSVMSLFRAGRGRFCPFRMLLGMIRPGWFEDERSSRDLISRKRFARLAVIGSVLSLSLYLIPHSIMVSPFFSIGLFILLGVIFLFPAGLLRSEKGRDVRESAGI